VIEQALEDRSACAFGRRVVENGASKTRARAEVLVCGLLGRGRVRAEPNWVGHLARAPVGCLLCRRAPVFTGFSLQRLLTVLGTAAASATVARSSDASSSKAWNSLPLVPDLYQGDNKCLPEKAVQGGRKCLPENKIECLPERSEE
jgi:hypothetical protein